MSTAGTIDRQAPLGFDGSILFSRFSFFLKLTLFCNIFWLCSAFDLYRTCARSRVSRRMRRLIQSFEETRKKLQGCCVEESVPSKMSNKKTFLNCRKSQTYRNVAACVSLSKSSSPEASVFLSPGDNSQGGTERLLRQPVPSNNTARRAHFWSPRGINVSTGTQLAIAGCVFFSGRNIVPTSYVSFS